MHGSRVTGSRASKCQNAKIPPVCFRCVVRFLCSATKLSVDRWPFLPSLFMEITTFFHFHDILRVVSSSKKWSNRSEESSRKPFTRHVHPTLSSNSRSRNRSSQKRSNWQMLISTLIMVHHNHRHLHNHHKHNHNRHWPLIPNSCNKSKSCVESRRTMYSAHSINCGSICSTRSRLRSVSMPSCCPTSCSFVPSTFVLCCVTVFKIF